MNAEQSGRKPIQADSRGVIIYRASRLEALLGPLQKLMQDVPPQHVLAPHSVIAAHPGMQRWLSRELALRRGPRGIVANLRIELPSEWLDRLALAVLGEEAVALRPYRRDILRWRIHECLGDLRDASVAAYLGDSGGSRAQRRFQLAERLARIYTRYLVYRPDWLLEWAAGRDPTRSGTFLSPLWKMLHRQIDLPHRGEMIARLLAQLEKPVADVLGAEPLHVFGLAHLAPVELEVLRAVARHRPVILYVPDPCREFWGGLRTDRQRLRELARQDPGAAATESAFLDQRHPLLANWGRMGQHFMLALDDIPAVSEVRDWQDQSDAAQVDTRLHRIQESIRQLEPGLIGGNGGFASDRVDRSLRVHACHTRLRELEVLRDALLRERKDNAALKPSDIVVMMPDIQAYMPLLPTVFGAAGRHEGPLPYHCFDVAAARSHSLFTAFRQLLDLPQARMTAPEIVDLLRAPEIARRLGLGVDDVDVLAGWLRNGRVAWGLDGAFRARFDVPAIAEHTFAWGMDRLLAGHVLGVADDDEPGAIELSAGERIVPVEGVYGPQSVLVGALDTLLIELAAWSAAASSQRKASEWAAWLEQRFESLFAIDPTDRDAREAKAYLLRFIRAVAAEPAESALDPLLDFSVVREVSLGRLDAVPERQRFLLGGVTFCGMVPQRAIPFKVVAVLGLNDGEFPRAGSDSGLDLMTIQRRLGDRDVRSDDRYLFLETLMSARDTLHLSYIGEGARDGQPRNPAAPLAELITALDAAAGVAPLSPARPTDAEAAEAEKHEHPWFVRHPLQPFDDRYFDRRDASLFSFRRDFAAMRRNDETQAAPFVSDAAAPDRLVVETPAAESIALSEVLAYYKDPAKQLLASALNLRLDALGEDGLRDSEPLDERFEAIDQVAKRLFVEAVSRTDHRLDDDPPDWLRLTGLLPPGRLGTKAWKSERDKVQGLIDIVRDHDLFAQGLPRNQPALIDRRVAASDGRTQHALQGEVRRVYEKDGTLWVMELYPGKKAEGDLDFKARIGFFLEWALLRLDDRAAGRPVRACVVVAGDRHDGWQRSFEDWNRDFSAARAERDTMLRDIERRVAGLIEFWGRSQRQPQWYFPATSWVALKDGEEGARAKWLGGYNSRAEREYTPGYALLLAGEREFDGDGFATLCKHARDLEALIDLKTAPRP